MAYRDKVAYLADHRSRTFGLGAAIAQILLVPGVNLIALGLGAAGATVAMIEAATSPGAAAARRSVALGRARRR